VTASKTLSIAALFALFTCLTVALGVYQHRQGALTLEGNSLYSPDAVAINATAAQTTAVLRKAHVTGRIFASLSDDRRIRVVHIQGAPALQLPIHSGRQPRAGDDRVALVGAAVPLQHEVAADYYVYENTRYTVIAALGLEKASLVADEVLLIDARLFAAGEQALVVDSEATGELYQREINEGTVMPLAADTNRRTNIDYVSPILTTFGGGLTLLGFAFAGSLGGASARTRFAVAHLVGEPRWHTVARGAGLLMLVTLPLGGAGIAVLVGLTTDRSSWVPLLSLTGLQILLALVGYVMSSIKKDRSDRPWT
jgi:hypothetical protein